MNKIGNVVIPMAIATGIVVQGIRGENLWVGLGMGFGVGILSLLPIAIFATFMDWRSEKRNKKRREKRLRGGSWT